MVAWARVGLVVRVASVAFVVPWSCRGCGRLCEWRRFRVAVGFKMPRRIGDANGNWWRDGKLRALVVSALEIFVAGV